MKTVRSLNRSRKIFVTAGLYFHATTGDFQKEGEERKLFCEMIREISDLAVAMGFPLESDRIAVNLQIKSKEINEKWENNMEYKYSTINEVNHFEFGEAVVGDIQLTERPDVACSYLCEGHILLIVDNSPAVLLLPGTIFQFTQSPEDYYNNPLTGTYFRMIRFLYIPVSLLLLPVFLLLSAYYPEITASLQLTPVSDLSPFRLFFYVLAVEFLLDLFKYSAALSSSRVSGALSIVGGLLIGDIAVSLNWASTEVLFYAAVTMLANLSLSSIEFADALRIYRILLVVTTGLWGLPGFIIGLTLVSLSMITTPTFAGFSYFWPLFPFNGPALRSLLFRRPTYKAQPSKVWFRGHVHTK